MAVDTKVHPERQVQVDLRDRRDKLVAKVYKEAQVQQVQVEQQVGQDRQVLVEQEDQLANLVNLDNQVFRVLQVRLATQDLQEIHLDLPGQLVPRDQRDHRDQRVQLELLGLKAVKEQAELQEP